ncbi:MAG: hypothetical protein ACXV74_12100 [Methylobacter sp.]
MKDKKRLSIDIKKQTKDLLRKLEKKLWIKRKTDWLMDGLGEEILYTFKELGFDEDYIQDKQSILAGKDKLAVLLWCDELDSRCKTALADRLGLEVDDFNITLKTLAKLWHKKIVENRTSFVID